MIEAVIQPYDIKVFYFKDKDKMGRFLLKKFNEDDSQMLNITDGRCLYLQHETMGVNIVIGVFNDKMDTLTHECNHAILFLFQEHGLNPFDSMGEHFCYLHQKLFKDLIEGK